MTCSIVVPVYGQADLTERCLDALLADRYDTPFQVVVVDDGSRDRTPELLTGYGSLVHVVRHDENAGFASSCNDGAAAASGELLVFLNNDTIPCAGWLDALVAYANVHRSAAIVGAKLLYPDETVQHAGVVIDQYGYPKHIYGGFPGWHPATGRSRRFQAVTAACMLVRRAAFEQLGGFDPAFRNGYEDVDLCLRAAAFGEVHYCAESVLYHLESMSDGRFSHAAENDRLWTERWLGNVPADDFRYYAEDGLIGIRYTDPYPLRLDVSPLLAVVEGHEIDRMTGRLLALRTRRAFAMTKELAQLSRPGRSSVRCDHDGTARWLSGTPTHRLVSVVVQTGDSVATAERVTRMVLSQQADEILEVVAIESHGDLDVRRALTELDVRVVAADRPGTWTVGDALPYIRGEIVVLLAPEAEPVGQRWLAGLLRHLDDRSTCITIRNAAGEEAGTFAIAARTETFRRLPPAALHARVLDAWVGQAVERGVSTADAPRSLIALRELSTLELFARGVVTERVEGADDATPRAEEAAPTAAARRLAEELGRVVERRRHACEDRGWVEDPARGRVASGVWEVPA
jgi:GT2 family glycosyltransferase